MVVISSNLEAAHGVLIERAHAQAGAVQDDGYLMHQRRACTRRVVESHEGTANFAGVYVRGEEGVCPLASRQREFLAGFDEFAGLDEAGLLDGDGAAAFVVFVPDMRRR